MAGVEPAQNQNGKTETNKQSGFTSPEHEPDRGLIFKTPGRLSPPPQREGILGVSTIEFAMQHAPRWGLAPSGGIEPPHPLGRPTRPGLSLFIPLAGLSTAGQRGVRPHHRLLQTLQRQVFLPAVIKHCL